MKKELNFTYLDETFLDTMIITLNGHNTVYTSKKLEEDIQRWCDTQKFEIDGKRFTKYVLHYVSRRKVFMEIGNRKTHRLGDFVISIQHIGFYDAPKKDWITEVVMGLDRIGIAYHDMTDIVIGAGILQ